MFLGLMKVGPNIYRENIDEHAMKHRKTWIWKSCTYSKVHSCESEKS
jgi:hypothetical protein